MTKTTILFFVWSLILFSAEDIRNWLFFVIYTNIVLLFSTITYRTLLKFEKFNADPHKRILATIYESIFIPAAIVVCFLNFVLSIEFIQLGGMLGDSTMVYLAFPFYMGFAVAIGVLIGLVLSVKYYSRNTKQRVKKESDGV